VFPNYRSPQPIRNKVLTRRLRGLNPDRVDEYVSSLADQGESTERERSNVRAAVERAQAAAARSGGGAVDF
jgi:DivIVA domain-containing protein